MDDQETVIPLGTVTIRGYPFTASPHLVENGRPLNGVIPRPHDQLVIVTTRTGHTQVSTFGKMVKYKTIMFYEIILFYFRPQFRFIEYRKIISKVTITEGLIHSKGYDGDVDDTADDAAVGSVKFCDNRT